MRARLRRNRPLLEKATLAFLLPAVAGAINASGFFAVGTYTSHMTGMVSHVGDDLAQRNFWLVTRSLLFVGSFVFGAAIATALVIYSQRRGHAAYWRALLVECALVMVFATVSVGAEQGAHINSLQMTSLLCCAMGLQNALVTRISSARIRTTHLTGVTTDIGIEITRMLDYWLTDTKGMRLLDRLLVFPSLYRDPRLKRLRIHLAVWFSFLIGGTTGPVLYLMFGHLAMLLPAAVLAVLAAFDAMIGLTSPFSSEPIAPASEPALPRVGA